MGTLDGYLPRSCYPQLRCDHGRVRQFLPEVREYLPLRVRPMIWKNQMSMTTVCAIVGAVYHPGASDQLRKLEQIHGRPGSQIGLYLQREPGNPHDRNAVAVWVRYRRDGETKETQLGYIPRQDAKVVATVMDAGVSPTARYSGNSTVRLYWPAETKEAVDAEYRRVMLETEGI